MTIPHKLYLYNITAAHILTDYVWSDSVAFVCQLD